MYLYVHVCTTDTCTTYTCMYVIQVQCHVCHTTYNVMYVIQRTMSCMSYNVQCHVCHTTYNVMYVIQRTMSCMSYNVQCHVCHTTYNVMYVIQRTMSCMSYNVHVLLYRILVALEALGLFAEETFTRDLNKALTVSVPGLPAITHTITAANRYQRRDFVVSMSYMHIYIHETYSVFNTLLF